MKNNIKNVTKNIIFATQKPPAKQDLKNTYPLVQTQADRSQKQELIQQSQLRTQFTLGLKSIDQPNPWVDDPTEHLKEKIRLKNKRDVIIKQKLREIKIKHILQKPIDEIANNDLTVLAPSLADRSKNNSQKLRLNLSKIE